MPRQEWSSEYLSEYYDEYVNFIRRLSMPEDRSPIQPLTPQRQPRSARVQRSPLTPQYDDNDHTEARNNSPRPYPTERQAEVARQIRGAESRMSRAEPLQLLSISNSPPSVDAYIRLIIRTPCCLHIQEVNISRDLKGQERLCRSCSDTHGMIYIVATCQSCGLPTQILLKEW